MSENLFSYGSLQLEAVQLKTFGRTLEGYPAAIIGYKPGLVKIEDAARAAAIGKTHHQNILFTDDKSDLIDGMVFLVTKEELLQADKYEEPDNYKRIFVELLSGESAWVYVSATNEL